MKLNTIFLCDSAAMHPDNTFSTLRGGIDRFVYDPDKGGTLSMTLVAIVRLETTETGRSHTIEISILNMDGAPLIQKLTMPFNPPASNRPTNQNILAKLSVQNPPMGEYSIYVNADGIELGSHPLMVMDRRQLEPPQTP